MPHSSGGEHGQSEGRQGGRRRRGARSPRRVRGAVLTEYRGLTVAELAALRRELAAAGGDYKVYKNTLVRLAVADGPHGRWCATCSTGRRRSPSSRATSSAVAKALRDFARANPSLVIKGGMLGDGLLSAAEMTVLADLPPRDACWPSSPAPSRLRCSSWPASSRHCPGTWPTGLSALLERSGRRRRGPEAAEAEPAESPTPSAASRRPSRQPRPTARPRPPRLGRRRGAPRSAAEARR